MSWLISLLLTLPALNLLGPSTLESVDAPEIDRGGSRVFFAILTGDQVVPPVNSNAFGWAIMWLDRSGCRLRATGVSRCRFDLESGSPQGLAMFS